MPDTGFEHRYYNQICFACGARNPHGLRMQFERDGADGVRCHYQPREADQGFPGVLHGGILASLLDESMAWALWAFDRALGVTGKMEMRYRRPAPAGEPLVVLARVERARGRRIKAVARIEDTSGETLVEAGGLFLRLSPEEEQRMATIIGWADPPAPDAR